MIGISLCSGIGAPEVAAPWVDWRLASEIEPFPRAVLQERFGHRLPEDHNQGDPLLWGDMTEVTPDLLRSRGIPLPDLIVAGTPCQDFSVAGLRAGLSGDRGNLTLSFVEICHAIVDARPDGKLAVLWENVPGVLSDSGNAFGCFLGGLVGAMDALPPPANGSWPGEGMVQGPRARAAWAVLDAQWFGVAQRRRRVFVVVDFGNCVDPAAVLLEPDRLRGDSPPRRETGERPAPTISARTKGGGGLRTDFDCDGGMIAHTLKGEGFDASEDGTGRGTPIVPVDVAGTMKACRDSGGWSNSADHAAAGYMIPVAIQERAVSENPNAGPQGKGWQEGVGYTLEARHHVQAVVFDPNQVTSKANRSIPSAEVCHTLPSSSVPPGLAAPWAVRRLMPVECARLQGFPDDQAAITYRGKPAADGPQYKAYGNSMCVNVMAWILSRMKISMEDHGHG